jgi:DNA-binding transcriptional ArsR family regulator
MPTQNSTNISQSSPEHDDERNTPHRPRELDKFVDDFLSLVCDTSRRYILELLAVPTDEDNTMLPERRSGDIARAIGLSAATTSEHLRQLANAGLVSSRREGNTVYYSLRNQLLVRAFQDLLLALDKDYQTRLNLE